MADTPPKAVALQPPKVDNGNGKSDEEPKRSRGRPRGSGTVDQRLTDGFTELLESLAVPFAIAGDFHCAGHITNGAEPLAKSWVALSKQNKTVRRFMEKLTEGSAWGGVVMATASFTIPILSHHGIWPWPDPFTAMAHAAEAAASTPAGANGAWDPSTGAS